VYAEVKLAEAMKMTEQLEQVLWRAVCLRLLLFA
jgi:hypothetical protein